MSDGVRVSIDDNSGSAPTAERPAGRPPDSDQLYARAAAEQYAKDRSQPTAQWILAHPEWAATERNIAKLTAAHYKAISEDAAPDSPEYFRKVESYLGVSSQTTRRSVGHAVPGYRPGDPNTHVNGGAVVLTRGEIEACENGTLVWNCGPKKGEPLGREEMARRKAAMVREGRYNKVGG